MVTAALNKSMVISRVGNTLDSEQDLDRSTAGEIPSEQEERF